MTAETGGGDDDERPEPRRRRVDPNEGSPLSEIGRNLGEIAKHMSGESPAEQPDDLAPNLANLRRRLGDDHPLVVKGEEIVRAARNHVADTILGETDLDAGLREITTASSGAASAEEPSPEVGRRDGAEPGESDSDNT